MDATLVVGGILFRPVDMVDRNSVADRIAANFVATVTVSESSTP